MTDSEDLRAALTDVRSAYRLLHGYHLRVNGLFERFDEAIEGDGYEYLSWGSAFFKRPRSRSTKFWHRRWPWDLLPGYGTGVVYQRTGPIPLRRVLLQVIADDGYERGTAQPRPRDFDPAGECRSVVQAGLWTAHDDRFRDKAAWSALDAFKNPWDGSTYDVEVAGHAYSYRLMVVDLAEVVSDAHFDELVVEPVLSWSRG